MESGRATKKKIILFITDKNKAMKEKIKEDLKNKLAADFGRIAFSEREIENAIDLALNRCGYEGTIKKITKEAIEFLFA